VQPICGLTTSLSKDKANGHRIPSSAADRGIDTHLMRRTKVLRLVRWTGPASRANCRPEGDRPGLLLVLALLTLTSGDRARYRDQSGNRRVSNE
jgi:hypothetical protein